MESRFSKLKNTYKSDDGVLKGRDYKYKSTKHFMQTCLDMRMPIDYANIQDEYEQCVQELSQMKSESTTSKEIIMVNLDYKWVFKDFVILDDREPGNTPLVRYTNPVTGRILTLGSIKEIDPKLYIEMRLGGEETLDAWSDALRPFMTELKLTHLNHRIACETMLELFSNLQFIETKYIAARTPTVVLEGCNFEADAFIPWTKEDVTLSDLGPDLLSFFTRMEDHEYFCAIIASRLLGFTHEYTPYLYGKGGEGKSTFMVFLSDLVMGYVANLRIDKSDFGLSNCINKAFLFINDCNNPYIFRTEIVKKITGRDSISINIKHKAQIDRILLSTVIITSNKKLIIDKENWCTRRARPFTIHSRSKEEEKNSKDINGVMAAMHPFKNQFINYCIQSLEKVGSIKTGHIPHHPTYKNMIETEIPDRDFELRDFTEDIKFKFEENTKLDGTIFRTKFRDLAHSQNKDKYFTEDFRIFLEKHGVTYDKLMDCYHHITLDKVENTNTKFTKPKLNTYR